MTCSRRRLLRTAALLAVLLAQYAALAGVDLAVRTALLCDEITRCRHLLMVLGLLVLIKAVIAGASCLRHVFLSVRLRSLDGPSVLHSSRTQDVIDRSGLRGRVSVVEDPGLVACTSGVLRPRVIISTALVDRLTPCQLEAVLQHEKSHADAADPLLYLLIAITRRMFFYVPAVGGVLSWLVVHRELAADAHAVRECGVAPLAGALLTAIEEQPRRGARETPNWIPRLSGTAGMLESRLEQLETGRVPLRCRLSRASLLWTMPGVVALAGVAVGVVRMCAICFACADC